MTAAEREGEEELEKLAKAALAWEKAKVTSVKACKALKTWKGVLAIVICTCGVIVTLLVSVDGTIIVSLLTLLKDYGEVIERIDE